MCVLAEVIASVRMPWIGFSGCRGIGRRVLMRDQLAGTMICGRVWYMPSSIRGAMLTVLV